jgi:hypothetical protein
VNVPIMAMSETTMQRRAAPRHRVLKHGTLAFHSGGGEHGPKHLIEWRASRHCKSRRPAGIFHQSGSRAPRQMLAPRT